MSAISYFVFRSPYRQRSANNYCFQSSVSATIIIVFSDLRVGNEVSPIIIVFRSSYRQRSLTNNNCFSDLRVSDLRIFNNNNCIGSNEVSPIIIVFQIFVSATKSHQYLLFSDLRIGNERSRERNLTNNNCQQVYCFQIFVSATKYQQLLFSDLRVGEEVSPIIIVFRSSYRQRSLTNNNCFQISVSATKSHQ